MDSYAAQITRAVVLKSIKQLHLNEVLASTRSLDEKQKHDEQAFNSELKIVLSKDSDRFLSYLAISSPANNLAADNNKRSRCETRDYFERHCKPFIMLAKMLPATNAEALFCIHVQEKRSIEPFFTYYSCINDLKIFPAERVRNLTRNVRNECPNTCWIILHFVFKKHCIDLGTANDCSLCRGATSWVRCLASRLQPVNTNIGVSNRKEFEEDIESSRKLKSI